MPRGYPKKQGLDGSLGDLFNLKMLIWGDPGSGKTTFTGSYSRGPVHIYLTDPQGASVLRRTTNEITVDTFTDEVYGRGETYMKFWQQIQRDEKSGFYADLKQREGLVVVDSYTTLENYLVDYVAMKVLGKKQTEGGVYQIMRQDWPTISGYVLNFFKSITSLPCAVAVLCHSKTIQNDQNEVFWRPTILGQQADQAPRWFSEFMRCQLQGGKLRLLIAGSPIVPAASRLFLPEDGIRALREPTMDTLYKVFHGQGLDCKT